MTDLDRRELLGGRCRYGRGGRAFAICAIDRRAPRCRRPARRRRASIATRSAAYECTSINDGARTFPMPDTFVKNVPKEEALAAAEAAYMPKGMVTVPFNPQLINTGSKLVLIDCGNGVRQLSSRARARSAGRCKTSPPPASTPRASTSC